jgi:hypothetical protein
LTLFATLAWCIGVLASWPKTIKWGRNKSYFFPPQKPERWTWQKIYKHANDHGDHPQHTYPGKREILSVSTLTPNKNKKYQTTSFKEIEKLI